MKRLLVLLPLVAGGCTSLADAPLIGLPENAPARPETVGAFPAVHDIPPPRSGQVLSVDEQTRMEAELAQVRARQKSVAASDAAAIAKAGSKGSAKAGLKAKGGPKNPAAK